MKESRRFKMLTGDVNWQDHGGVFFRFYEGLYDIVRFDSWESLVGFHDADGMPTYNAVTGYVDPAHTEWSDIMDALRCTGAVDGQGEWSAGWFETGPQHLVALQGLIWYGCWERVADISGNNWQKLYREARETL